MKKRLYTIAKITAQSLILRFLYTHFTGKAVAKDVFITTWMGFSIGTVWVDIVINRRKKLK